MTDSKIYSSGDFLPVVISVAKIEEKQAAMLSRLLSWEGEIKEQSQRMKNIENKIYYAAGFISLLSVALGVLVNVLVRKIGG